MILKTLELEEFQCHRHSILEFSPGVNVIKGTSHSGKSSIIRALRWALFNEPRGLNHKPFRKPASTLTTVGVEFEEGTYIVRKRSSGENSYDANGTEIEAMRSDLPEEISQITQMTPLNLQIQEDFFFLFNESAGAVARMLNEHVGLEIIDSTLSRSNEIVNETRRQLSQSLQKIQETEEELKKYEGLNRCEESISKLDALEKKREALHQHRSQLDYKIKELLVLNLKLDKYKAVVRFKSDLSRVKGLLDSWQKGAQRLEVLNKIVRELEVDSERFTLLKSRHLKLKRIYEAKILPNVPRYRSLLLDYEAKRKRLYSIQNETERCIRLKENLEIKLSNLSAMRDKLLKEKPQEFCPQCGAEKQYWRKDVRQA